MCLDPPTDFRIINVHMQSFCMRLHTHGTSDKSHPKGFVESAQTLTPKKSRGGHEAQNVTVNHPCGDHARAGLTFGFQGSVLLLCAIDSPS